MKQIFYTWMSKFLFLTAFLFTLQEFNHDSWKPVAGVLSCTLGAAICEGLAVRAAYVWAYKMSLAAQSRDEAEHR
jgi:hypothetical protein